MSNWQKYTSSNPLQQQLIARFLRRVTVLAQSTHASSVLEAGCAEGFVLHAVREVLPTAKVVGFDIDREAIARGRELFPELSLQEGDLHGLSAQVEPVDLVLCLEVLEHLPDPQRGLDALRHLTKRYCLLSVPHEPFFCMANLCRGKNIRRFGNDPEHVNHWGKRRFRRFVEANGFRVLKLVPSFPWIICLAEVQ